MSHTCCGWLPISARRARKGSRWAFRFLAIRRLAVHAADAGPPAFRYPPSGLPPGWRKSCGRRTRCTPPGCPGRCGAGAAGSVTMLITRLRGLLRGGRQLDVVVEALAHLLHAVDADYLGHFGDLYMRLDQHVGVVAIVERAHRLAGELQVGSLVHAHRHQVGSYTGRYRRSSAPGIPPAHN